MKNFQHTFFSPEIKIKKIQKKKRKRRFEKNRNESEKSKKGWKIGQKSTQIRIRKFPTPKREEEEKSK